MREAGQQEEAIFSYFPSEAGPRDHPQRAIRGIVDAVFERGAESEAKLSHLGRVLVEKLQRIRGDTRVSQATAMAGRKSARKMNATCRRRPVTLGGDSGYDSGLRGRSEETRRVEEVFGRLKAAGLLCETPHRDESKWVGCSSLQRRS
jgi:hypothetical protein